MTKAIDIRDYNHATDEGLVFDHWMNSFKRSHFRGPWPNDLYYKMARETLSRLVIPGWPNARWGTRTLVAYSPEDAGTKYDAFGFVVVESGFDHPVCHYVCVKDESRRHGVARYLMEAAGLMRGVYYYTFRTPNMPDAPKLFERALFRPDLLWYRKHDPVMGKDGQPIAIVPVRDERRGRRRDQQKRRRKEMENYYAQNQASD